MKCNLCNGRNRGVIYKLRNLDIYKCQDCGFIYTDPKSIKDKLKEEMYEEKYYTKIHPNFFFDCWEDYNKHMKKSPKLKRFKKGIGLLKKYKAEGKILDIGCATGVFLDIAHKGGFQPYGVELSKFASGYAQKKFGIKIHKGTLENSKFKKDFFDIITMWDLIEHVPEPSRLLRTTSKLLKKDGILFILTINENSLMSWLAGIIYKCSFGAIQKPVELTHPVHHLYHFSYATLKKMLEKEGFKVVYTQKSEMPLSNIEGGVLTKILAGCIYALSIPLNLQHEIRIIAVKQ